MQAERGEITKKQAEAEAAAHGLEPFERAPELPHFDPKLKSHWSIVMAVAWIARRDFELVREQDPEFCSKCIHWIYRKWMERAHKEAEPVERTGYFLEARLPPTVSRLALLDVVPRARGNVPSTAVMTIREAETALWRALSEGHLIAKGLNTEGVVVEIPSWEWAYLRLREEGGRDVLRTDASRCEPYTAVKFEQSNLLRLWPATGESPPLPPSSIDKGGRPAEYDWAAVKAFAEEVIRVHGMPHKSNKRLPSKAQLIELIQKKWGGRDQHLATSTIRYHLDEWLPEFERKPAENGFR
jgi:hypothetical protein